MLCYLTFDIGTTSLKTALVSDEGHALAVHTAEYSFLCPRADWAEMKPENYWRAAAEGTRAVLARAGVDSADVAAIGFSSQGQTFIPIDRSGRELRDAIVWTDQRAVPVAERWEREWLSREEFRASSGYPWLAPELTVFKAAWMAEHEPDKLESAWKLLCLPDYLIFRMTGETVTDRVMGEFNGFFDVRTCDWNRKLLNAAGVRYDQMPHLLEPGDVAGRLRPEPAAEMGIAPGVLVCVGANDQIAGAVGAGNVAPGVVSETTGTALAVVATTPRIIEGPGMVVGRHAVENACYAMPFANTSAVVLKWFRDLCGCDQDYGEFLAGVESIAPGCDGLSVLPHFAGTASPTFNPSARGAMAGLTLGHTRAHIARAIMEACSCELRECVELVRSGGIEIETIRSLGGAARSDLWLQMKADMLGLPVARPTCSDAGSMGGAMMAAKGAGQFGSISEASQAWYRSSETYDPNPKTAPAYDEVYSRYISLYERLYG